jgi:hypothetical protein
MGLRSNSQLTLALRQTLQVLGVPSASVGASHLTWKQDINIMSCKADTKQSGWTAPSFFGIDHRHERPWISFSCHPSEAHDQHRSTRPGSVGCQQAGTLVGSVSAAEPWPDRRQRQPLHHLCPHPWRSCLSGLLYLLTMSHLPSADHSWGGCSWPTWSSAHCQSGTRMNRNAPRRSQRNCLSDRERIDRDLGLVLPWFG